MSDKFTILGLSDSGNVELEDYPTEADCRLWIKGYTKQGDWGGYYAIAIISPSGEYVEVFEKEEL